MSGRNIFLILVAVLGALGIYFLATGPAQVPMTQTEAPVVIAPRAPAVVTQPPLAEAPPPALSEVATEAAAEVERLKREQESMERPTAPVMRPENPN